jgi:N-acetylmuramoyl-L-alanine amidase
MNAKSFMSISAALCFQFSTIAMANNAIGGNALPGASKNQRLVVLDPGHGGHDTGASSGDAMESEIALKITKLVGDRLEKAGLKVIYTREKDEWVSLEKRALIANRAKADLFVSIHLNSSTDARAYGKEFYFQNQVPADEEALFLANRENNRAHTAPGADASRDSDLNTDRVAQAGLRLAEASRLPEVNIENPRVRHDVKSILEDLDRSARVKFSSELAIQLSNQWNKAAQLAGVNKTSGRAIRQAPFFLVSHVAMPSVLVEVGFLSHKREGARLRQETYQIALADSLASGIQKWTNVSNLSNLSDLTNLTVPQPAP